LLQTCISVAKIAAIDANDGKNEHRIN